MERALSSSPWYAELVEFFGQDLSWVRLRTGWTTSRTLRNAGLAAAATGPSIHLGGEVLAAVATRVRQVLAHEVAHVLQQTQGARWVASDAGGLADLEDEARLLEDRFAQGRGAPPRARDGRAACFRVQGHDSFEHRLLGGTPTNLLTALVAGQGTQQNRNAGLASACTLLDYLGSNPTNVDPAQLAQLAGFPIRTVTLTGSGLTVTYGELNTMADFLTSPAEIDTLEQSVLLPILQMTRESGWQHLNSLRSSPAPQPDFTSLIKSFCPGSVAAVIETQYLDSLTTGLGPGGRDHYTGVLARNACHFAPYTWWRWQASYAVAVAAAQNAYANGGDSELVRQTWLAHGYADHFLQDAFAAGHLINKTLVMQWFIDWVADEYLPVYGWDALKTLTAANQPGLSGLALYSPSYVGLSTDPQTSEEQPTQAARMANSGVVAAAGLTQQQAYLGYLAMLDSTVCQIVTNELHDILNGRSVTASSPVAQNVQLWGDDTLLNGGTGATQTSVAAQLSQQSITDILNNGGTDTTWQEIFSNFPDQVLSQGQWMSLQQWHEPGGELWDLCQSNDVFDSWETWGVGTGSHALPDLGIVSVDQPSSSAFTPSWGPVQGVGIPTATLPATCSAFGSAFVFTQAAAGGMISCTQIPGTLDVTTKPLAGPAQGPPAAGLLGGQLCVAYVTDQGTVLMLSSPDGVTWNETEGWAGISGADPQHGLAFSENAGTQFCAYVTTGGSQPSIAIVSQAPGGPWSPPQAVPNSSQGTFPAMCSDGANLYVAFQHGNNGIYAGYLNVNGWTGPTSRSGILTIQGVSLAYVQGTVYMGYWGTDKRLWWEAFNGGTSWSNQAIPNVQSTTPVTVGADYNGSPCLYYGQLGALASESRDNGSDWSNLAYSVGAYYSSTPPAFVDYGDVLYQFGTLNDAILESTYATTPGWSNVRALTALTCGAGRLGADVHVMPDGTSQLWLAATSSNDQSVNVASFDGTTWTTRPAVTGASAGAGDVAVAEFNDTLYVFFESGTSLCYAAWDDTTGGWVSLGAVPGVDYPASTGVTIVEDTLYLAYICTNRSSSYQRVYTVAWDGGSWGAPIAEGGDHGTSVSVCAFDDSLVLVFLGTDNNLNGLWSRSGGTTWNGKTGLGPAGFAPGLAVVDTTVGDDPNAQGVLAAFGAAGSVAYSGELSRIMTNPGS